MNLKFSFSWIGLVIFALPMLINIAYALFPPTADDGAHRPVSHWAEITEHVCRGAYLIALTATVSRRPLEYRSVWLYLAAAFLILYYTVWIRYFAGGRDTALLGKPFLLVPVPLAVFPVLYYLCTAVWLCNIPAAVFMTVFTAAHITVTVQSFRT